MSRQDYLEEFVEGNSVQFGIIGWIWAIYEDLLNQTNWRRYNGLPGILDSRTMFPM